MRVSWTLQWFSSLFSVVVMLSLTTLPTFVVAPNPFSENVVALTPENWKKEVLNYKHAVFIVFCRVSCAHCRELFPAFEKVARSSSIKGFVKLAYWDLDQRHDTPKIVGKIKGTPTLRLVRPKQEQSMHGKFHDKDVVDFDSAKGFHRTAPDLKKFLEHQMPSGVWRIHSGSGLKKIDKYADYYKLPQAIFFTSKDIQSSALINFLSTEFRNRIQVILAPPTSHTSKLRAEYDLTEIDDLPALFVKYPDGKKVRYKHDGFKVEKLSYFLAGHALEDPIIVGQKPRTPKTLDEL